MKLIKNIVLSIIVLGLGSIFSLFLLGAVLSAVFPQTSNEPLPAAEAVVEPVSDPVAQDPYLLERMQHIGATDTSKLNLSVVESYPAEGQFGEYQDHNLTVLNHQTEPEFDKSLAHEYLHHVYYFVMNESERVASDSAVNELYANDSGMHERMQWYEEKGTLKPTELLSVYCSESSNGWLSQTVLDICNKYINRGVLVMQR